MTTALRHPDSIPDLNADCRRALRDEYSAIQARISARESGQREYVSDGRGGLRPETVAETRARLATTHSVEMAIAEYRRVAKLWGVDVG